MHRVYGLIGHPLGHSFSQTYFNEKFASEGIDAEYVNFDLPDIEALWGILADTPGLSGLNVTIPYKQRVMDFLDRLDPVAREVGAVNVVKITRRPGSSDILTGYNTDVVGFGDSLRPLLERQPWHRRALVLGTGGASRAVCHSLRSLGVEPQLVSRTPGEGRITYADLTPEVMEAHTVVVNTTPLGMYPHTDDCPALPYSLLTPRHLCYDLLYNPDVTLFMRRAAAQGATVKNGLEMLLLQAFASYEIWQK